MNFKMIAAAAALVAAGAANASLDDFESGNSSVGFLAYNQAATSTVFIDLGVNLNDFVVGGYTVGGNPGVLANGKYNVDGTTLVWNFATSTFTVNGVAKTTATNNWSAYGSFLADLAANGQTSQNWGVIAGDSTINAALDNAQHFLTTGTPSATALNNQKSSTTANMSLVQSLYTAMSTRLGTADNGSYFTSDSANGGYLLKTDLFGPNWVTNLKWASTTTGADNNFWFNVGDGTEWAVGLPQSPLSNTTGLKNAKGTWALDAQAQTLTWKTAAAVPEPESYALALVGLAAAFVARRRAAK